MHEISGMEKPNKIVPVYAYKLLSKCVVCVNTYVLIIHILIIIIMMTNPEEKNNFYTYESYDFRK